MIIWLWPKLLNVTRAMWYKSRYSAVFPHEVLTNRFKWVRMMHQLCVKRFQGRNKINSMSERESGSQEQSKKLLYFWQQHIPPKGLWGFLLLSLHWSLKFNFISNSTQEIFGWTHQSFNNQYSQKRCWRVRGPWLRLSKKAWNYSITTMLSSTCFV